MLSKKGGALQLKDFLVECRTMKINGTMQVMPLELRNQYAASIEFAQKYLWKSTNASYAKTANFFGYLIEQCELAKAYEFPELTMREDDKKALSIATGAAEHAALLGQFLQNFARAAEWSTADAIYRTGIHLWAPEDFGPILKNADSAVVSWQRNQAVRLGRLLTSLSQAIGDGKVSAQKGSFLHRYRYGPFYFPGTKEGKQGESPSPANCLALFLAFRIGEFSAGFRQSGAGTVVELVGKPRWPLVEELVHDALGERIDPWIVRQFLRRNKTLQLWGYE